MGSSSSNSSTSSSTDKRVVTDSGIGVSGNKNTITVESVDKEIVGKALDTVQISDALNADSFNALLKAADGLFNRGEGLINRTQTAIADAYAQAQDNTKSTIDNRTVIVLGIAAAGVATAYAMRKK